MRNHETGFERISRVRQNVLNKTAHTHSFDQRLAHPEQFKNRGIRALIHVAKHLDELAESCADISGVTERLTRNLISSGEKADLSLVMASALGRVISGQLNIGGVAVHKVAGAGLYALSTLLSVAALALTCSQSVGIRSEAEIEQARRTSSFDSSAYLLISEKLLDKKETMLGKLLDRQGQAELQAWAGRRNRALADWARLLHPPADPLPTTLEIAADDTELRAGEKDTVRVILRALDQGGNVMGFFDDPVEVSLEGSGRIVGPSLLSFKGGAVGVYVEAGNEAGHLTLTATCRPFGTKRITFNVT